MGRAAPLQGGVLGRLAAGLQSLPAAWSNAQRPAATMGPCLGTHALKELCANHKVPDFLTMLHFPCPLQLW